MITGAFYTLFIRLETPTKIIRFERKYPITEKGKLTMLWTLNRARHDKRVTIADLS